MKNLLHNINNNRSLETFFIIFLLCIFTFGALLVLVFGVNVYQNITVNLEDNFDQTTVLSYVASKIRQCNSTSQISVQEKDGINALVLNSTQNNLSYETWIYCYDGYIYEIYVDADTEFELDDGIPILHSYGLDFFIDNNNLLTICSYTNELPIKLSLYIRCNNIGGNAND